MWARALAGAVVTGDRGALTRRVRHMIGRSLIRGGEIVFIIDVQDGQVRLLPASAFEVMEGWRYRAEVPQPPGKSASRTYPRDQVAHFTWNVDPRQPWAGISPMASAAYGAKLASNVEDKLGEETGAPSALILPFPMDGGDAALDLLRGDIKAAKGGAIVLEGTASGQDDATKGTRNDWRAERLGPMIPEQFARASRRRHRGRHGELRHPGSPGRRRLGTVLRCGKINRRWVMSAVQPVADLIAEEASAKLDSEVVFSFATLHAHDIAGRAGAVAKLTTAGIPVDEARRLAGLS